VRERVTLVIHDWGSTLGFDWRTGTGTPSGASAYMEAMVGRHIGITGTSSECAPFCRRCVPTGEQMVLQDNFLSSKRYCRALSCVSFLMRKCGIPSAVCQPGEETPAHPHLALVKSPSRADPSDVTAIVDAYAIGSRQAWSQAIF